MAHPNCEMAEQNKTQITTLRFYGRFPYLLLSFARVPRSTFVPENSGELFTSPTSESTRATIHPPAPKCRVPRGCCIFWCTSITASVSFVAWMCLQ